MAKPDGWSGFVSGTAEIYLDFSGAVDKDKEIEKIIKEIEEKESYEKSLTIKLTNKEFTDNAPKAVVDKEKEKLSETQVILDKLQAQLKTLS
jgi:valyl-tRNA synthetase